MTPPTITITMLGAPGSGKSMYLLGLYAVMSAGLGGYSLHARDSDVDLDLSELWDALCDQGEVPVPTTVATPYGLVFRRGFTPLMNIDWLDYRGGAMNERSSSREMQDLATILARSDSVYLTVNGAELIDGVTDGNVLRVRKTTHANRMLDHLHRAVDERDGAIPSIVILITKADLLFSGRSPTEALQQAAEAVRQLLPDAFGEGTVTMVCPVSLGRIGSGHERKIDGSRVSPRWVQKPIVFSLFHHLSLHGHVAAGAVVQSQGALADQEGRLAELRSSVAGNFRRRERRQIQAKLQAGRQELEQLRDYTETVEVLGRALSAELEGPKFFIGGSELEYVHD